MQEKKTLTRNAVGWGYVENAITQKEKDTILKNFAEVLNIENLRNPTILTAENIILTPARVEVPPNLNHVVTQTHHERLLHAVGRSFRDLAKLRETKPLVAPDAVACPQDLTDLQRVLEWAYKNKYALIPFGGGSSVVGGVNPEHMDNFEGVISVDLQGMQRVLSVSTTERVVHAEAGILGPALDLALKPYKMHTRYSPQSFHHSTLGGWVVTRGAGHNSTVFQKIEDRVQAVAGILADGRRFETRPLPATSIGIDPLSYWAGSEGILGFLTDVRLRVYALPEHRGFRALEFPTFQQALNAAREIAQSEIFPIQLRILDEAENVQTARLAGLDATNKALLILGDESTLPWVETRLEMCVSIAKKYGGITNKNSSRLLREWVRLFFRQPYIRDFLMEHHTVVDTFETAIPWEKAHAFYRQVQQATIDALQKNCEKGHVGCRVTHVYSDGPCLYFSFYGPGQKGRLTEQWGAIKDAASEAVVTGGGTMSHHHAMGRDHAHFAKRELSEVHRKAIVDLKHSLDPKGIMNPGLWLGDETTP